mgnify:CR=1 FL=1
MDLNELKAKIQIGKYGVTENIIDQVRKYINKHGLVKVKMLKTFAAENDKNQVAQDIAERTNSHVLKIVGFTIILQKNKFKGSKLYSK